MKCTYINARSFRRCRWSLVSSANLWENEHYFRLVWLAQQRAGPRLQFLRGDSNNLEELNAIDKASTPQVQTRQLPLWRATSPIYFYKLRPISGKWIHCASSSRGHQKQSLTKLLRTWQPGLTAAHHWAASTIGSPCHQFPPIGGSRWILIGEATCFSPAMPRTAQAVTRGNGGDDPTKERYAHIVGYFFTG